MQMGDHRLDHLRVLSCMETVGIIGTGKIGAALQNHAWFYCTNFGPDPGKMLN
jgi:lactate dehydrogenase-like 2-hydroxyacid dehydrogenase